MEQITVKNLLEATKGTLLCGDEQTLVEHISIDSRTMKGNDLFVPLIGEKVDAHDFISQALEQGAAAVLTSRHQQMDSDRPWIHVEDTKKALQEIGSYYRRRLTLPLIGVTGSVGKTTTREMIAAALSAGYQVYKTPANHNSQVGVPITLSEIKESDQIGVIELGMSEPGELTIIAKIAMVDMAVITNVGVTHIEQLGSRENIYREKLSIQDGLKEGGFLFLNGDDELLKETKARPGFTAVYYGTGEHCEYRAEEIELLDGYPSFVAVHGTERIPMKLQVMGTHQVLNAMVSLAVADRSGVSMADAARKLEQFGGFKNRQQVYETGGLTIIDDTYNASPISMKAAIDILVSMKPDGRRIAVLADMKELGVEAPLFHYEIGEYLAGKPVDVLVTLGELASEIGKGLKARGAGFELHSFTDKQAAEHWLFEELKQGDLILFKGSNSMKLGEVVEHVRKYHH